MTSSSYLRIAIMLHRGRKEYIFFGSKANHIDGRGLLGNDHHPYLGKKTSRVELPSLVCICTIYETSSDDDKHLSAKMHTSISDNM